MHYFPGQGVDSLSRRLVNPPFFAARPDMSLRIGYNGAKLFLALQNIAPTTIPSDAENLPVIKSSHQTP
jgi:hypothetical protein